MGPTTSNTIFGFRSDVLLKLLNLLARRYHPTATEQQVNQLVPLLLQQLYERMQKGDTSVRNTSFCGVFKPILIYLYGQIIDASSID